MAISPAALFGPIELTTTPGAIYTAPTNVTAVVTRAVFTNISGGAVRLTVWIVRGGNSRGLTNLVIGNGSAGQVISAGPSEPYIANSLANLVLMAGDAIHAVCDTAASLNAVGSGWVQ